MQESMEVAEDEEDSNRVSYSCTLSPFFDHAILVTNATYSLTLKISSDASSSSSFTSSKASHILPTLTVITESPDFHQAMGVSKSVFLPLVMAATAFFICRSYQNDLYVSIPDRLLISAALALILNNVPIEFVVKAFASQDWTSKLKLASELISLGPLVANALFWSVYTRDKLAGNEPWERNTKYYAFSVGAIALGACLATTYVIFTQGPSAGSRPFQSHWLVGTDLEMVSLGLLFTLAGLSLMYQTYLAVVIFRFLCDISLSAVAYDSVPAAVISSTKHPQARYGGTVFNVWRIKMVLLYCFIVSILTVGAFILKLAIHLGLNWNPQFYSFPVPLYMSFSSPFLLGMHGKQIANTRGCS